MKNSKYIKVSVSDRTPDIRDYYDTNVGLILFTPHNKRWETENDSIEYWLHEVPDYEDEMKEMLEEAIQYLTQCDWRSNMIETYGNFVMNAQEVLSKIK
ncbi:hypothetical protein ABE425_04715 [Chryseobacterium cucumeris]|uniref:hypothetical protein n=1 Tax=Chryseobacterium cucumeris TaxID=1813611 RepID=UPI003209F95A